MTPPMIIHFNPHNVGQVLPKGLDQTSNKPAPLFLCSPFPNNVNISPRVGLKEKDLDLGNRPSAVNQSKQLADKHTGQNHRLIYPLTYLLSTCPKDFTDISSYQRSIQPHLFPSSFLPGMCITLYEGCVDCREQIGPKLDVEACEERSNKEPCKLQSFRLVYWYWLCYECDW